MTIQDAHTDDYPRDIDIDLMSPEQPRPRFKYTDEETLEWARGLGAIPQDHSNMEADARQLRETNWQVNQVRHRVRNEGGVNDAAEGEYIKILEHARALEQACKNYLSM